MTITIALPTSESAQWIATEEAYAAYAALAIEEEKAYHAWLDAGGHEVDGNDELLNTLDALTTQRWAKYNEWAAMADGG